MAALYITCSVNQWIVGDEIKKTDNLRTVMFKCEAF